jgi:hypothetical protein
MQTTVKPLLRVVVMMAAAVLLAAGVMPPVRADQSAVPSAPQPLVAPITRADEGMVAVDGNLGEWGALSEFLDEQVDWVRGPITPQRQDRAAFALRCSDKALYVALKVSDASVHNAFPPNKFSRGDCVELFFDFRPPSGTNDALGNGQYTPGVYSFLLCPPVAGRAARVHSGRTGGTESKGAQVAGALIEGGYTLELCLPFDGLDGMNAARLKAPIGFDLLINDSDLAADGKPEPTCIYSWSGGGDGSRDASRLARASTAATPRTPYARTCAPRLTELAGKKAIYAAVVTAGNAPPPTIELTHQFRTSAFDQVIWQDGQVKPAPEPLAEAQFVLGPVATVEHAELGMRVYSRALEITSAVAGCYEFGVAYGANERRTPLCYYVGQSERGPVFESVAAGLQQSNTVSELAKCWARIELRDCYPEGQESIRGQASLRLTPAACWLLSQESRNNISLPYRVRLVLTSDDGNRAFWQGEAPFQPRVPVSWDIPLQGISMGIYQVHLLILGPDGKVEAVAPVEDEAGKRRFPVRCPLVLAETRSRVIRAVVADAPKILSTALKLGSPNRRRFPKDDPSDAFARTVWDLHVFEGRIYVGCGDWDANRGPIDIYSFAPAAEPAQVAFEKEFTVQDESVDLFRDYGRTLYVPGIDAKENWTWGNLYTKSGGKWEKHRTVPNGVHVLDAAEYQGKLYVGTGLERGAGLFVSSDGARSFTEVPGDPALTGRNGTGRFWSLLPVGEDLLVLGQNVKTGGFRLIDGKVRPLYVPLAPGCPKWYCTPKRVQTFGARVVYTLRMRSVEPPEEAETAPFLVIDQLEQGAAQVDLFRDKRVCDIVARAPKCHVLTSRRTEDGYEGVIYTSEDLVKWTREAVFKVPAPPASLETLGGKYFVGLGASSETSGEIESGSIWVILSSPLPARAFGDGENEVR